MQRSFIRLSPVLLMLILLLTLIGQMPRSVAAQAAVSFSTVTAAYEGNYAPGRWLPISVGLRNDGPLATVTIAAELPNAASRNTYTLDLAGGAQAQITLYVAMDTQARSVRVSLIDATGTLRDETTLEVRPRPAERMLGVAATNPPALRLPLREELFGFPLNSFPLNPANLPTQLAGLSSLSMLILSDAVTTELDPQRRAVLLAWVRGGGHLFVGGGASAASTLAGLPQELIPAELGPALTLNPTPFGAFVGDTPPIPLDGITLRPAADTRSFGDTAAPLWVVRDVGLGRVTQLAFDPGLRPLNEWANAPRFWDLLLQPAQLYGIGLGAEPTPDNFREQTLASSIIHLPAIALPNSAALFVLLALYTIIIGPGVALLLRRMDGQDRAWIMLPLVALVIGAAGTGIALTRRSDQRIVTQASLVEQINADTARVRSALGILTPRAETFPVELDTPVLLRPIPETSSTLGTIGGIASELAQEGSRADLTIAEWQLQHVLLEALAPLPRLDARLELNDLAVQATVRNTTGQFLRDVIIVFGGQTLLLGDLAPEGEVTGTWPPPLSAEQLSRALNTSVSQLVVGDAIAEGRMPGNRLERQLLIREALINAAVVRANLGDEPGPFVFAWLDESPVTTTVTAPGAAGQHVVLLVNRPVIRGSGNVFVPPGWMRIVPPDDRALCSTSAGRGVTASPEPVTVTLRLPNDLASLNADLLTLDLDGERTWPNAGVQVEVFDVRTNEWFAVSGFDGPGELVLSNASNFVAGGEVRVRVSGRIAEVGCLFVNARLTGQLP